MQNTYQLTKDLFETELDRYLHNEMTDEEEDRFLLACEANPEYEKKVNHALYLESISLVEVAQQPDESAIEGFTFDEEDEKQRAKEEIQEAIGEGCYELAKQVCTEALELWPSSPEFEQLLAQIVVAKQIQKLSGSDYELFLRIGEDDLARFSMSSASDEELEIELPSACDISFVTEAGDVIYSKSLSDDNLFMVDEAAVRSASGDLESVEIWDDEPSFEEELFGGRIVVSVHRGNISGKLKIRLKGLF